MDRKVKKDCKQWVSRDPEVPKENLDQQERQVHLEHLENRASM
ncbi:hypothetical protein OESDEN_18223 [Oesophagostomum dentatum]|uniref:Uncharacterized protein n=1 Tax=Oesophagostomum dentatum TaxID=61180 RepID=A0A0B1SFW8_OESDE|nr:hypothetical protein OESDEN_18223 [Oesophagostomum dentatum]